MKKLAAYYLLLLYAASLCKPATIWFADVMAHSYFSHQHSTVVHHEEGHRHVHQQINKAAKDDAPEQKTAAPRTIDEAAPPLFVAGLCRTDLFVNTTFSTRPLKQLPAVFLPVPGPPPWA